MSYKIGHVKWGKQHPFSSYHNNDIRQKCLAVFNFISISQKFQIQTDCLLAIGSVSASFPDGFTFPNKIFASVIDQPHCPPGKSLPRPFIIIYPASQLLNLMTQRLCCELCSIINLILTLGKCICLRSYPSDSKDSGSPAKITALSACLAISIASAASFHRIHPYPLKSFCAMCSFLNRHPIHLSL